MDHESSVYGLISAIRTNAPGIEKKMNLPFALRSELRMESEDGLFCVYGLSIACFVYYLFLIS